MARVPAVAEALAILRYLARHSAPSAAGAIVRELALPRSTVYHLLGTLEAEGFVIHIPDDHLYAIGLAAYEVASGYVRHAPLQQLAKVPIARLVDATGYSGHLAVLEGHDVLYTIEERARGRRTLITDVGVRLPAHVTASGRAILAALPSAHIRTLADASGVLARRHGRGPATAAELLAILRDARVNGYATEDNEVSAGFSSVGAAIFDRVRRPIAAVALTFPTSDVDPGGRAALARRVMTVAAQLTNRIGGIGRCDAELVTTRKPGTSPCRRRE